MKVLKTKTTQLPNVISCSSSSRRVMSPFGVVEVAIHLVMCPFPCIEIFFYLVQRHFVVFQPFPSHILCLWLSLDFSLTDKLISFIHTWSFSLLSPRLDFFPLWHPSSFQLAGHRALLYENSLDLKGRSEVAWGREWGWGGGGGEGGGGGLANPTGQTCFRILSVTVKASHQSLACHQRLIVCLPLIDTG